jgi:hypothetical protein
MMESPPQVVCSSSFFYPLVTGEGGACDDSNAATLIAEGIQAWFASFWASFRWQTTLFVSFSTMLNTIIFLTIVSSALYYGFSTVHILAFL